MQITMQHDNLNKALALVGRAVSRKSTLPVLHGIAIQAEEPEPFEPNGTVILSATDLAMQIRLTCTTEVKEPGGLVLPADLMGDWVRAAPNKPVTIVSNGKPKARF